MHKYIHIYIHAYRVRQERRLKTFESHSRIMRRTRMRRERRRERRRRCPWKPPSSRKWKRML
jgi:hypothetical protein